MAERELHFFWRKLKRLSLIGLIILWILSAAAAVYQLRQNNLEMLKKREAVFTADKDNKDLETALKSLQTYVTTHMHTALPKLGDHKAIELKYTYDRLVAAEDARVTSARVQITNAATSYCESTLPTVRLTERAICVQNYIEARPVVPKAIAKELYSYDFYSPTWSNDLAGWLIITFIVLSVLLVSRIILGLLIRRSLKSYI